MERLLLIARSGTAAPDQKGPMSARQKLNVATVNGCLLVAGTVAYLAGSWTLFAGLLLVLLLSAIGTGGIRFRRR